MHILNSLFISVNEERLNTGVYPLAKVLLDNFNPQIGEPDPELDAEISAFLDAVLATEPMQVALSWLTGWGNCIIMSYHPFIDAVSHMIAKAVE